MKFLIDKQIAIKNSRYFVGLFVVNVLIISCLNGLLFQFFFSRPNFWSHSITDFKAFVFATIISICVFLWFTGESIKKYSNGFSVAKSLGAAQIKAPFIQELHRRFYNIVEEMAIASGVPVPAIFLIENESSINAFASGASPKEAVIVVTSGALENLSRDELQAVIGHEFSHILYEDMSLNGKIAGAVNGFMFFVKLAERQFSDKDLGFNFSISRNRSDRRGSTHLFAIGLWIIGSVGFLLGRIMQSQISRQREYLADASSVQFTRNPRALATALAKIAKKYGSAVYRVDRYELGHFFFADVLNWHHTRWFNTHPSMEERIFKILGVSETIDSLYYEKQVEKSVEKTYQKEKAAGPLALLAGLPEQVKQDLQSPEQAKLNFLSIVISLNDKPDQILEIIRNHFSEGMPAVQRNLALIKANSDFRSIIFQIALNPLKTLSLAERTQIWGLIKQAMVSDNSLTLKEALILFLLRAELKSTDTKKEKIAVGKSILQIFHWTSKSETLSNQMKNDAFEISPNLFESTTTVSKLEWDEFKKVFQTLEELSFKQRNLILEKINKHMAIESNDEKRELNFLLSQCLRVAPTS